MSATKPQHTPYIDGSRLPDPTRGKTTQQLIDGLCLRIRGMSLKDAFAALCGQDLILATSALRQELGASNAQIIAEMER